MKAAEIELDTSVVLRLLVAEPADQYEKASAFLFQSIKRGARVHVGDLVLAEACFALQSFYGLSKKDALKALGLFVEHSGVHVDPASAAILRQPNLASAKPGFVDRIIHGACRQKGRVFATFEKSAAKLEGAHLL
jgi:predicted nucleic-acid-binding protein